MRDDDALGASEDLDRDLDGVPHAVVGLTALFSVMLAMLVTVIFITGNHVAAIILALLAIPVIVTRLRRKANRERDHIHPSR